MIVACGYKKDDFCKCYEESIIEVEKERNEQCCNTCHQAIEVYTEKDKVKELYRALWYANHREKFAHDVMYMRGLYGHHVAICDDIDDIFYTGYTIWLVLHKKKKYYTWDEFLRAYRAMKLMGMKIPKRIKRIVRRYKKHKKYNRKEI